MKRTFLLALVFACAACSGGKPDRVVIGIGMTSNAHNAVRLAVREINASGGVGGVPIELVGLDSTGLGRSYDPLTVLRLANRFAETSNLLAVVGHSDSASTLSAAAIYNKAGIPQIVTIATNPAITNIGAWTYRLCLSDAAQGPALAEYAVNDWGKRRIAVFYVNDDYGRGLAQAFERRAGELGATIVESVMHRNTLQADDEETIQAALGRLKETGKPDLVAMFQRVAAATWTMRAINQAGLVVDKLGGDNLTQRAFVSEIPDLANGMRVSQFSHLDPANARAHQFMDSMRGLGEASPDYAQSFAYDAVYLLRDAVVAGNYTREGVKAYFDGLISGRQRVEGIAGPYSIGNDHDARRALYIAQIDNGDFHVIKSVAVR